MKVYLVHHADALPAEVDPQKHISEKGREQADRVGARLRAIGVAPARILHSDKQWTIDTALRVAAQLDAQDKTAEASYPIGSKDPVEPFLAEIAAAKGDIIMCGHWEYLERAASKLVCGDESRAVIKLKPG